MSIKAMVWAFEQDIANSSAKFLLVALCDYINTDGLLYPSIKSLEQKTNLDRKTIIKSLDFLEGIGVLNDTGRTIGAGVKVYSIVGLPSSQNHYIYVVASAEGFYIGRRSCDGDPMLDTRYMGSGSWPIRQASGSLKKYIYSVYKSLEEARIAEAFLLNECKDMPRIMNKSFPKVVPHSEPVPHLVLVPKTELPQYQMWNYGSTKCGTGVVPHLEHGTVTESSINRQGTVKTLRRASLDVETPKAKTPNDLKNKSSKTWDAYSNAYFDRYKCEPIRNAKVSGQLCQLVDRVGAEDAPYLAAFYLTHNNSFYAGKRHSVDALLRDCEGLMTDMRTGHRTTQAQAIQADKTQTNVNVFQKLMQENRNKQTAGV